MRDGLRIEVGDPLQYAGIASQILQAAWKPPCIHYSTAYVAWQFSFPSDIPMRAAVALLDDRAVGCMAVTSRRFVYAGERLSAYVLSFVAVNPSASRRGFAGAMYASLLDALPIDVPVVAFAEPDSVGEHLLLNSFSRATFRHHPFLACRAVGYLRRPGTAVSQEVFAQEAKSYAEFAGTDRSPGTLDVIWTDITEEHWHHYQRDPRGRIMVSVRDGVGNPLGAAMLVTAELISSEGMQKVPMLDSVALANPTADAVAALFAFAAERSQPGSIVVASNVSYVAASTVKGAGARALPSSFNAHVFVRGRKHIVERAAALNLEVI